MSMTATRVRILENQQTGIARKVYEAVPINEQWPTKQIVAELHRQGLVRDFSIVEGCLNSLKESGLIKEMSRGYFQRARPKVEAEKEAPTMSKPLNPVLSPADVPLSTKQTDPVNRLADIGTKLRELSKMFLGLADDIDNAALALDEKAAGNDEELAKLRQLKGLLKSLS